MSNLIPKAVIIEREKTVWQMRMTGHTYESIAKELGITFGGVRNILKRLHKRYRDANMDDVEACRLEQIGELTNIAKEAYAAWERSKGQKITIKKRARSKDGRMLPGEASEEKYESDGDTRYLQIYLKAKEDLRKIMGADAPSKLEHTGKNGEAIKIEHQDKESARNHLKDVLGQVLDKPEVETDQEKN